jgi:hypothetical protein
VRKVGRKRDIGERKEGFKGIRDKGLRGKWDKWKRQHRN